MSIINTMMIDIDYLARATGYVDTISELEKPSFKLKNVTSLIQTALAASDEQALGVITALAEHDAKEVLAKQWQGELFELTIEGFNGLSKVSFRNHLFEDAILASKEAMGSIDPGPPPKKEVICVTTKIVFARALYKADFFKQEMTTAVIETLSDADKFNYERDGVLHVIRVRPVDQGRLKAAIEARLIHQEIKGGGASGSVLKVKSRCI